MFLALLFHSLCIGGARWSMRVKLDYLCIKGPADGWRIKTISGTVSGTDERSVWIRNGMMRLVRWIMQLGIWLAALAVFSLSAQAAVLRCHNSVLTVGDSSAELLLKCGKPLLVEPLTASALSRDGELTQVSAGERWTFDMGKGYFMQIVTLQNGVIQKIEDGPRN